MKEVINLKKLGLYIHIPFCVKKCNYCDFFSIVSDTEKQIKYIDTLIEELKLWNERLESNTVIDTVYIGGGTPSVLWTDLICKLLDSIRRIFTLSIDTEITIEANPNSLSKLNLVMLKDFGLNRISMGMQSANDEELKLLGRTHNRNDVSSVIENIHKSGITNFSLDVMTGIPLQTFDSLKDTLRFCIDSGAAHISTYMLKIEKGTPFYNNRNLYEFADEDLQADFYEFTCDTLAANGFRHYEISNFCKDDKISRHNMKYWQLDDYLGIGPSAHSLLDGKRFYYPKSFEDFENHKIIEESVGNTEQEYIMLSLRTDIGFEFSGFERMFNTTLSKAFYNQIETLEKYGLVKRNNNSFCLTDKGFLVSNTIISRLLDAQN